MSYDQYMLMFYISLGVCIAFFILSIVLFFVLKIPKAFGDVTGLTRKKAIKNISEQAERMKNEKNGVTTETDRISASGRLITNYTANTVITEKIGTANLGPASETTVLSDGASETTVLSAAGETSVLSEPPMGMGETSVLDANMYNGYTAQLEAEEVEMKRGFIREIKAITFIHTTEVIQ